MKLKGKVAIVTGAGRGLGRASALALAAEGADLVIASRTPHELEETALQIIAAGGTVVSVEADVARLEDVLRVIDNTIETFGSIDILLNNAAVVGPLKPLHEITPAEWEQTLAIDLQAPYMLARGVVPAMIRQKSGKIINVTSGLGEIVMSPFGVYSVAKAGLNHLTRIMAEELKGFNIQVNGLDPGVMDTPMQAEIRAMGAARLGPNTYADFMAMKERGLLLPPEQVARLAVFLASPAADRLTGEIGNSNHYQRFGYQE